MGLSTHATTILLAYCYSRLQLYSYMFTTQYQDVLNQVEAIDPIKYAASRNYIDGAVTKLSPYISRGVISTRYILDRVLDRGYKLQQIEKFVQELAWRDYYQQVWIARGNDIDKDLRSSQPNVKNYSIPTAIIEANTGIQAIDDGIHALYDTGYMHNHVRMYVASIVCNMAGSHWYVPAQWLYYYLLDADWASNALSWQWTAAAFSSKKYYANQDNINKYCHTRQSNTFVDVDYNAFEKMQVPKALQQQRDFYEATELPTQQKLTVDPTKPTVLYTFYNLDPNYMQAIAANRVLILEPAFYKKYPVSTATINFIIALAGNIEGVQLYVGSYKDYVHSYPSQEIYYKEHPTNTHFEGIAHPRDFIAPSVVGYYPSFFGYWKKVQKQLGF